VEELGVYYSGLRWQLYKTGNFLKVLGIGEDKIILKRIRRGMKWEYIAVVFYGSV
jgi:hypothetical protein